jgi:hypothetical protein
LDDKCEQENNYNDYQHSPINAHDSSLLAPRRLGLLQQLRQLSDIRRDPARLITVRV